MIDVLSPNLSRRQRITKRALRSSGGIAVTQNRIASGIAARVLKEGGHAVDAAVAAGFALGVVEPWMSGAGGVGGMVVLDGASGETRAFDFGGVAPATLKPEDFSLVPGADGDIFGWPAVAGGINTTGAKAVVVPSQPLGLATAHRRFGRMKWRDLVSHSVAWAEQGPVVDWFTTLMVAGAQADLARDPASAARFLKGGGPPVPPAATAKTPVVRLPMKALAATLGTIADDGAGALYRGPLADGIARDIRDLGGYLSAADLAGYRVRESEPLRFGHAGRTIHVLPELTGGPTLGVGFAALEKAGPASGKRPDARRYGAYADALRAAWTDRFSRLGDQGEHSLPTCTTHLSIVDRDGNMVALTQTLLSLFGARITLPTSGLMMNNGINWFDPRPGMPNSIRAGGRVLANYTPAIMTGGGEAMATGGCGGRKIIPAVFQLLAMQADYGMGLQKLFDTPRLDVSGLDAVVADSRMSPATLKALGGGAQVVVAEPVVSSNPYTLASAVLRRDGINHGQSEPLQPWCEAVSEDDV
jgi:gamma-glutamyltranspeptidase / glutathione hydrolase